MKPVEYNNPNIISDINLLLLNIPEDTTPIEKIRWIYIKLGCLFSYDYHIAENESIALKEIDYSDDFVGRFETCRQISSILNIIINQMITECHSEIIERKREGRGQYSIEHTANVVTMPTGEKYLLDLTLDLYLIQSGCQTKQFGFTSDAKSTYDIISSTECLNMDQKMGLIQNNEYTDLKIQRAEDEIHKHDYTKMSEKEIINYQINFINNLLIFPFYGHYEGKQFINKLFQSLLSFSYKEFNFTYQENKEMSTCFEIFDSDNNKYWYFYSNTLNLVQTNEKNISNMLKCGWKTKSNTLEKIIGK